MAKKTVLKDGNKQCTICKQWKPLVDFVKAVNTITEKASGCKVCVNSIRKLRYHTDSGWKENFKLQDRKSELKRFYNLTPEDIQKFLEQQNNSCKICNTEFNQSNNKEAARVDHDHKTGKIRGLLCANCNVGLGNFRDSVENLINAISYLKESM